MRNRWSDKEADRLAARLRRRGVGRDVALRVYGARLLGAEPALVLHGGGNSSVKTAARDRAGDEIEALFVKGSGHDMAAIGADGFPALRLAPLADLARLRSLIDEAMVDALSAAKLSATAPAPSVETLLHAFLPAKYVDHTHANAVLALTNQRDGEVLARRVFGDRAAIVPYVMSGFALAKRARAVQRDNPDAWGLIVPQHGIFTYGATAKESYARMIRLVTLAEKRLARGRKRVFPARALPAEMAPAFEVAPVLRGLVSDEDARLVMDFRTNDAIRAFVSGRDVKRYAAGTATPDHVIRTKPRPLIVEAPKAGGTAAFRAAAARALRAYEKDYRAYTRRHGRRLADGVALSDSRPRVILVPGLGLYGLGETAKAARIAADIAEANVQVITDAERVGRFQPLDERHVFDIEYWPLERAKLTAETPPFAGTVVLITGAGSGIGRASAEAFRAAGAEIVAVDLDRVSAERTAEQTGGLGLAADVTRPAAVARAFDLACQRFGGVDVVVSNAGAAWQGEIGTVSDAVLRKSFELNFFAHQSVAQNAVRVMRAQGTGGALLFNVSKQAVNPGPGFGPYGLPKAATLALVRHYAVDHGKDGIRVGGVNADRIRSGLLDDRMIAERSRARGVSEHDYMAGNLLGREVTAADVAQAFVALAQARATTGAVLTVDGGNAAAFVR